MQRFFRQALSVMDEDFVPLNLNSTLRIILNGLRIYPVFLLQYACSECVGGIILIYWDHRLDDDRPRIDPFIGKMDRTSCKFYSIFDCLFLNMSAWKRGEQSRMDVHNPAGVRPKEFRGENSHKTGHYH